MAKDITQNKCEQQTQFEVNDAVVVVRSARLTGFTGHVVKIDKSSSVPINVVLTKDNCGKELLKPFVYWFPASHLVHNHGTRIHRVDFIITRLMDGVQYYTENGSVLKYEDGKFFFNKSKLNINKLHDLPLTRTYTVSMNRRKLKTGINEIIAKINTKVGSNVFKSTFDENTSVDELTRTYDLLKSLNIVTAK